MRRTCVLSAFGAALLVVTGAGAQPLPVRADQTVRVTAPEAGLSRPTVARVVLAGTDTLLLQVAGAQFAVGNRAVLRMDSMAGTDNRLVKGGFGVAIGAGLGYGLGKLQARFSVDSVRSGLERYRCESPTGWCIRRFERHPRNYVMPLALLGTVAGGAVGYLLPGRRWRPVPLRVDVGVGGGAVPTSGELSVTVRF